MTGLAFLTRAACVALLVLLLTPETAVAGPNQTLRVKDLKVEFVSDTKVRVQGKVKVTDMVPREDMQPWSEITVHVDFPHGDEGFSLLPDCFEGKGTSTYNRDTNVPSFKHRGKWYAKDKTKKRFYQSAWIVRPAVLDQHLDNEKHEGQWIAFDKTLDFAVMPVKQRAEYRVVIGWTIHAIQLDGKPGDLNRRGVFWHYYLYGVYGPFRWGEAPACDKPLVGTYCRPASFTQRGVEVVEPVSEDEDAEVGGGQEGDGASSEKPEKRPKLKRPDEQPTHLEAFEASEALQAKLVAMPEVESGGVGLPPKRALLRVAYKAGLDPQALTKLVAAIALETAYAAPWIDTLEMMLDGDQISSRVVIPWDALVKHSAGETTLAEFFETWEVGGDPLAAPVVK